MLPCGKKHNRLKPHGHINHIRKINQKQVEEKQQKKRDWAMGWMGPGLNVDERGDWRSHCPDSFTLWCLKMKLVAMETHHLQAGLPLIHSFIHVTWAVLIRAPGVCCEHVCVGVCSTCGEHQPSSSCLSGLVWLRRQTVHSHVLNCDHNKVNPLLYMLVPTILSGCCSLPWWQWDQGDHPCPSIGC